MAAANSRVCQSLDGFQPYTSFRSDAVLVEQILRNDVSAFKELYDRYARFVYSVVFHILGQTAPCEELVQDVFLQLWQTVGSYDESRGSFVPWLAALSRNKAFSRLRLKSERQRRSEIQSDAFWHAPFSDCFEQSFDNKRLRRRLHQVLASLRHHERRVIELAYLEGLSHTEIATRLQQPLGTVKSRIRRGLQDMRLRFNTGEPAKL
jgi:RNA polymerase sigma-70 factor, ECF subfamily